MLKRDALTRDTSMTASAQLTAIERHIDLEIRAVRA